MAAVDDAVARNLARLLRNEPQTLARLARAYGVARRDIDRRLRALEAAAELELAAGRPLTQGWLLRERAMVDLLATVERTVGDFAAGPATTAVNTGVRNAAALGAQHATGLVPAAGAVPVNPDAVARIVAATTNGPVRQVLDSLAPHAVGSVSDRLLAGVISGRPLNRIAADVSRAVDVPLTRTRLIVRTEVLRAYRSAQLDVYANHPDVPEWMWVAAKDSRCCAACWAMHGTKHRTGTPMKAHPGCRCTAVPVVKGDDLDLGDGAAALAAAPDDVQRRVLGPAAKRALDAGVLDLRTLVGVRANPTWGESVYVRSLRSVLGPDGARRFYLRGRP